MHLSPNLHRHPQYIQIQCFSPPPGEGSVCYSSPSLCSHEVKSKESTTRCASTFARPAGCRSLSTRSRRRTRCHSCPPCKGSQQDQTCSRNPSRMFGSYELHSSNVEHYRDDIILGNLKELLSYVILAESRLQGQVELVLLLHSLVAAWPCSNMSTL